MTPELAIAALDRALEKNGETVVLRRVTQHKGLPSSNLDVTVRVLHTGAASYDFAGGIQLDRSSIILSPSQMVNSQWCWPVKKRDMMIIDEKPRLVEESVPVKLAGVIVRYNIQLEEVGVGTLQG